MFRLLADTLAPSTPIDWIQSGGIIGMFLFIIFSGIKKMWVFGWAYVELKDRLKKCEEETEGWKQLALRSTNLAESLKELGQAGKLGP